MSVDRHLVVFAKEPRLGRVKSRLARDIGRVAAWRFYRHLLSETTRRLRRASSMGGGAGRYQCWLAVTPDNAVFHGNLWPNGWNLISQGQGDLGQRMARIMDILPSGPVVIVGSDIPNIQPRHISDAFQHLSNHDAVLGPAPDGGYWLVGLKRRPRVIDAFADVRWSSPHAIADTLANLGDHRTAMLDTLEDVDDGPSFERWRRRDFS